MEAACGGGVRGDAEHVPKAVVANHRVRARTLEHLTPANVLVAPVVHELGTCLEYFNLRHAHRQVLRLFTRA